MEITAGRQDQPVANLDLRAASLAIDEAGWKKAPDMPGAAKLVIELDHDRITQLSDVEVKSAEVKAGRRMHTDLKTGVTRASHFFLDLYLDADVELDADAVRALVAACASPEILAAAPQPRLDLDGVGPVVKRVYRVHEELVAPGRALAGAGAYLLTERGHARVFPMPDVISDDGFVHASFAPHERVVVRSARSVVHPARTVRAYLNRRVRVRRGNRQLAGLGRSAPEGQLKLRSLVALVAGRRVSPLDGGCYLAVLAIDRALTRLRRGGRAGWGSDVSSRVARPGH